MAKFSFSNKSNNTKPSKTSVKTPVKKNIKVELIKHERVEPKAEFYSYINAAGDICKYSGLISTDIDGSYVGKVITTHEVILKYHPTVESVEHVDEYFSYIDNNGKERIFNGKPTFDLEKNSYVGDVEEEIINDEIVNVYKEDK